MISVSYNENRCLKFVGLWNERAQSGDFSGERLSDIIKIAGCRDMKLVFGYENINEVFDLLIGFLMNAECGDEVYGSILRLLGYVA